MAAQTILLDFSVDPARLNSDAEMKSIEKDIIPCISNYLGDLKYMCETLTDDGRFALYADKKNTLISIRFFRHGLFLINIEYYKADNEQERLTFEVRIYRINSCYQYNFR